MLLFSVVPVVVVVVLAVVVLVVAVGVEVEELRGFDVVADEVQSTLSGQSHCLLDGLKRRPGNWGRCKDPN